MSYIHAETQQYPLSSAQVASAFPNISFPSDAAARDEEFAGLGYYRVVNAQEPSYDPATHRIVQHAYPSLIDGSWTLEWDVIPLTQAELDAALTQWREVTAVTPRQMRLALLDVDLLDTIEAMMPSLPRDIQIEWEYSVLMERKRPEWDALGAAMDPSLAPSDIDDVFMLALTKV